MSDGECSRTQNSASVVRAQQLARKQERKAVTLALVAGAVDAYGIITYHTYLSYMSGNTTQTGYKIGQGDFAAALPSAVAIVFFVAGSFAGSFLAHSAARRPRRLTSRRPTARRKAGVFLPLFCSCKTLILFRNLFETNGFHAAISLLPDDVSVETRRGPLFCSCNV
jgi:uncharacterized membrane protein YoaK (UPF0700 family)